MSIANAAHCSMMGGKTLPYKKRIQYLESTGTQYVNTGVYAVSTISYELKYGISYTNPTSPNPQYIGADNGGTYGLNGGAFLWGGPTAVTGQRYEVGYKNTNGSRSGTVDGISYPGNNFRSVGYKVLLFTASTNSEGTTYRPIFAAKLYYAQVYIAGVLVRDLIPVIDKQGVACVYDRVSGALIYNAGSGSFVPGPDM